MGLELPFDVAMRFFDLNIQHCLLGLKGSSYRCHIATDVRLYPLTHIVGTGCQLPAGGGGATSYPTSRQYQ